MNAHSLDIGFLATSPRPVQARVILSPGFNVTANFSLLLRFHKLVNAAFHGDVWLASEIGIDAGYGARHLERLPLESHVGSIGVAAVSFCKVCCGEGLQGGSPLCFFLSFGHLINIDAFRCGCFGLRCVVDYAFDDDVRKANRKHDTESPLC